jgi:hypothetical protein
MRGESSRKINIFHVKWEIFKSSYTQVGIKILPFVFVSISHADIILAVQLPNGLRNMLKMDFGFYAMNIEKKIQFIF